MPSIQVHHFENGNKTTALLSERTIETYGFIRLFIGLNSVMDHYMMPAFPTFGGQHPYLPKGFDAYRHDYKCLPNNKARINYCCDLVSKPHIFPEA